VADATGWRLRTGFALFALGLICPVFVPLVTATDLPTTWKATLSGLLMLGLPELLWIAAAAVLGKEGFAALKARLVRLFKRHVVPREVGRTRHRIGVCVLLVPILFGWLAPYLFEALPVYREHRIAVALSGDLLLLAGLVLLGGGFWEKLHTLFLREQGRVPDG
jgi:hypothetical protein